MLLNAYLYPKPSVCFVNFIAYMRINESYPWLAKMGTSLHIYMYQRTYFDGNMNLPYP